MHRITPRDTGFRAFHGEARGTVNEIDDDHNMQEMNADQFHSDNRKGIERVQNYGFSSVPLGRDQQQQGGGQGGQQAGGGGQGGDQDPHGEKGPAAEAFFIYPGGNRSLPVIVAVDDRRHRPYGLKGGESIQYDDQGQATYLQRDGLYLLSNKTEVSLRHVEKKPQQRKTGQQDGQASGNAGGGQGQGGAGQGQSGAGQGQGQQSQSYDHKGTVNTEVRAKKDRVDVLLKKDVLVTVKDKKVYLGGDPGKDKFALVLTEEGPSKNVYAKV
jgi:phage gp45-like